MPAKQAAFDIRLGVKDAAVVRKALENLGRQGEAALGKLDRAARRADGGLKSSRSALDGLTASARVLEGPLGGVAGRLSSLGFALRTVNPLLLAGGAAISVLSLGTVKAVKAYEAFERQQLRINQVLRATRVSSGQTAESIEALARSIGDSTLASTQGVRDAAAALLTFRSVSGEAFGRTLRLSQDLAEVFGTDLKSASVQLGKALEDPERNLSQLNRSGISFTTTQIEVIKRLRETGDEAGAMALILQNIENQVGGTGEAAAGGLTGAWDSFAEAIKRALENAGEFIGIAPALTAALNSSAGALNSFLPESIDAQAAALRAQFQGARGRTAGSRRAQAQAGLEALKPQFAARGRAREQAAVLADLALRQRNEERAREAERAAEREDNTARLREIQEQAKAIGRLREAELKRDQALEKSLVRLEQEAELARLTGRERAVQTALLRAQATAGRELSEQERARLRAAVETKAALDDQAKALEEAARVTERSIQRVTDFGADAIFDALEGRAGNFWEEFVSLARRSFAQIAAEALIRPIVTPLIQGAVGAVPALFGLGAAPAGATGGGGAGGGGTNAVSALGSGAQLLDLAGAGTSIRSALATPLFTLGGGALPTTTAAGTPSIAAALSGAPAGTPVTAGGLLGAGGAGFLAGQVLAGPLGLNPTTASLGAGAGAAIGFALGGPLGALAGGGLGLLGGLIGGGQEPPNRTASGVLSFSAGGRSSLRRLEDEASAETRRLRDEIAAGVGEGIAGILGLTGGRLRTRSLTFDVGERDPTVVVAGGARFEGPVGDANFALSAALRGLLSGGLTGVSELVNAGLSRSAALRQDPAEILADAELIQALDDLRAGTGDLARGLRELNRVFADTGFRARELELPLEDLIADFRRSQGQAVGGFFGGLIDPLVAVRAGLSATALSPGQVVAAARAQAEATLQAARGGDLAAIRAAPGAVAAAEQAGAAIFPAASGELAALRADLGAELDTLIAGLRGEQSALTQEFGLAIEGQTRTLQQEIRDLRRELKRGLELIAETSEPLPQALASLEQTTRELEIEQARARQPGLLDGR